MHKGGAAQGGSNRFLIRSPLVLVLGDGLHRHLVHSLGEIDHLQPLLRQRLEEGRLLNSLSTAHYEKENVHGTK